METNFSGCMKVDDFISRQTFLGKRRELNPGKVIYPRKNITYQQRSIYINSTSRGSYQPGHALESPPTFAPSSRVSAPQVSQTDLLFFAPLDRRREVFLLGISLVDGKFVRF